MAAQILVVKPGHLLNADKDILRAAGVVCIEDPDPDSVRLIQPEGPILGSGELFYAAIHALSMAGSDRPAKMFTETMTRLIEQRLQDPK